MNQKAKCRWTEDSGVKSGFRKVCVYKEEAEKSILKGGKEVETREHKCLTNIFFKKIDTESHITKIIQESCIRNTLNIRPQNKERTLLVC